MTGIAALMSHAGFMEQIDLMRKRAAILDAPPTAEYQGYGFINALTTCAATRCSRREH